MTGKSAVYSGLLWTYPNGTLSNLGSLSSLKLPLPPQDNLLILPEPSELFGNESAGGPGR